MSSAERDDGQRAAVRAIRFAVVAVGALIVGIIVLIAVKVDEPRGRVERTAPGSATSAPRAASIGPAPGADIAPYADARRASLAAVGDSEHRLAVVSFVRYRTDTEASDVLTTTGVTVQVVGRLVAVPGGEPDVVTIPLVDWAPRARAAAVAERASIAALAPSVSDPEFSSFYSAELDRLAAVAADVDPDGAIVYGLLVIARADDLRALAARSTVRLVDVGASDRFDPADTFRAPMPDEVTTVAEAQLR